MRVLDRTVVSLDLDKVGMDADTLEQLPRGHRTSPTASCWSPGRPARGKTTTLYSALNELNDIDDKIITTEDPVEYDIDGIVQVPIDADDRHHVRHVPAGHPAAGPGQDPGRRDPRPGDGRNRRAGVAHRAHGVQHAAHQRRAQHDHAAARHGRAAVPDHRHGRSASWPSGWCGGSARSAAKRSSPATEMLAELELTPDDVAGKTVLPRQAAATPATTPATRAASGCSS